jgi:Xaa-Pro aminopeptidase
MSDHAPWQTIQTAVRERGAVAAVAASPESVRHLAGIVFPSQVMIRRRFAFVVVPAEGEPTLMVQAVLEHTARSRSTLAHVTTYVTGPTDALIGLLTAQHLDRGVLLVELDFLPSLDAAALERTLKEARLEDGSDLFTQARRTRSPAEVDGHRRYTRAAERAIQVAFALAPGATERQVHARMQDAMQSLADGTIPFLTLASGPERTMLMHALPEHRVIRSGDLLRVDVVGFFGGIYTDMARTVVVGQASSEQRATYRRVRDVQREVIDGLRPGLTAGEVYDHFTQSARSHGLGFTYRYVGHSTGYQVVEDPVLTTGNTERLQAGMVLCVEVMDLVEGVGGVHIEDMLLLTKDGAEVWTGLMASEEIPEIS